MNPELWQRIPEIVALALDVKPELRSEFIDHHCGDDPELLGEVRSLLDGASDAAGFLEKPALISLPALEPGDTVGDYVIIRELGSGGMGAVYLGRRQDEALLGMEAAIKVLHTPLDSEDFTRRFEHERISQAQLRMHPNIATILDGGATDDGQPYFVMEYIDGVPIDEYCDEHQLSIDERLQVFLKVCDAVQHAHKHRVVHKDIKPGNILVTEEGEPVLLDFGIAETVPPETEASPGNNGQGSAPSQSLKAPIFTPRYAAPEQYRSEAITTACDVYSLGVLLYELLSGRCPYGDLQDSPTYAELERAVCFQIPVRLSQTPSNEFPGNGADPTAGDIALRRSTKIRALRRKLRGDLDNIVEKALSKAPDERYASVSGLMDNLTRHLRGLPIDGSDQFARLAKHLRRHFMTITLGVLVIFSAAMLALNAYVSRISEDRYQALEVTQFLVNQFFNWDPRDVSGTKVTASGLLDESVRRIREEEPDLPEDRAALLAALGAAYAGLGMFEEAEPLLEESLELHRQSSKSPGLERVQLIADLAVVKRAQALPLEAESGALTDRRPRSLYEDAEKLELEARQLVDKGINDLTLAKSLNAKAYFLNLQGHGKCAEFLHRLTLEIFQQRHDADHPDIAGALHNLGTTLFNNGQYDEAREILQRSLERRLHLHGPESVEVAKTRNVLTGVLINLSDFDAAEDLAQESLRLRQRVYAGAPGEIARARNTLATVLRLQGKVDDAKELLHKALAEMPNDTKSRRGRAAVKLQLANLLYEQGELDSAFEAVTEALELLGEVVNAPHWRLAEAESVLGAILLEQGNLELATRLLLESYPLIRTGRGSASYQAREARQRLERLQRKLFAKELPVSEEPRKLAEFLAEGSTAR